MTDLDTLLADLESISPHLRNARVYRLWREAVEMLPVVAKQMREAERWETGFRNIVTAVFSARKEFEIPEIVTLVESVIAERDALRKDKERLDALEAMPWAMSITYNPEQPKSDSVPPLRSQIDYFLSRRAGNHP